MKPFYTILLCAFVVIFASCRNNDRGDSVARRLNTAALERYREMRFSKAYASLDSVAEVTHNQVELMVADVLRMKISQRTADLRTFYRSWHSAQNRLKRINQELEHLDSINRRRTEYAESEMHTIAATYYYYARQDSLARCEMALVAPVIEESHDTAEWTQYLYMMGSGGMVTGDSAEIRLEEFDYLLHAMTVAHRSRNMYFEANALQSLSQNLETGNERLWIKSQRRGGFAYLIQQHSTWMGTENEDSLPLAMIRHSLYLFQKCGDIFQQTNVLRTESEILFNEGEYEKSLLPLKRAEQLIGVQHERDSLTVPYWEARIAERLSLTYSALGDHYLAAVYRNLYLDLVDSMSQDLEEEARTEELAEGNRILYIRLCITAFVALALAFVLWLVLHGMRRRGRREALDMMEQMELLKEETVELKEKLQREKFSHIERRSKVSLAEAVVPYINRMLKTDDMVYVGELADRIMQLNDMLTRWIQVQRGRLSMNISSFALQPVFDIIAKNRSTYRQNGLTLEVEATDLEVKADKVLTLFMLNTLADNARKFTPEGGKVLVSAKSDNNEYVELSVSDTGCGLKPEDVDTLNNSKVWDASRLGNEHSEGKGFGFGLMNCKGIISQMKKASNRFSCCQFGVESEQGKGSRFWFRLPRVMSLALILLVAASAHANLYDSLYSCNVNGRYEDAYRFGKQLMKEIPEDSLELRMNACNEMAIAAEGLCRWSDYKIYNRECMHLHRVLTADPNLPLYAERLHKLENEANWALVLTASIVLSSLFVFVMVVRVSRRKRQEASERDDEMTLLEEEKGRVEFELDRLHISDQILDNCLSTIKHETMYYPARIRQMVDGGNDRNELSEVMVYYNEMYTLLLAQAERETQWRMPLDGRILEYMKGLVQNILKNLAENSGVTVSDIIWKDETAEKTVVLRASMNGVTVPADLFTPESGVTDAMIVREIIRMHDAASGHPGLRLWVENNEICITIWRNSKLLS